MKIKILTSMALLALAVGCFSAAPAEAYGRGFHRVPHRIVGCHRGNIRHFRHWRR